jgi:hypothetical protein
MSGSGRLNRRRRSFITRNGEGAHVVPARGRRHYELGAAGPLFSRRYRCTPMPRGGAVGRTRHRRSYSQAPARCRADEERGHGRRIFLDCRWGDCGGLLAAGGALSGDRGGRRRRATDRSQGVWARREAFARSNGAGAGGRALLRELGARHLSLQGPARLGRVQAAIRRRLGQGSRHDDARRAGRARPSSSAPRN